MDKDTPYMPEEDGRTKSHDDREDNRSDNVHHPISVYAWTMNFYYALL